MPIVTFDKKIKLNHNDISETLQQHRNDGKKIVLTQGSWDLIHIGHGRYIAEAKKHGDVLVIGVDSDAKIKKRKGPERPIVPEAERMEMIAHLGYVDMVTLKAVDAPKWSLIKLVKPDVLIVTERMNYTPEELEELKIYCGDIVLLESQATTSTSAKIRLLQMSTAKKLEEALKPKLIETIQKLLDEVMDGK